MYKLNVCRGVGSTQGEPDNWSHGHLIPCHFCQTGRLIPSSFARLDVWSHPISDKEDYWSHHISSHLTFIYLYICLTIVLFIYFKLIKRFRFCTFLICYIAILCHLFNVVLLISFCLIYVHSSLYVLYCMFKHCVMLSIEFVEFASIIYNYYSFIIFKDLLLAKFI